MVAISTEGDEDARKPPQVGRHERGDLGCHVLVVDAALMVEDDGVGEDDDGQQEVAGDQVRVQLEEHDEAAEHDLSRDAGDEAGTDHREIPPRRAA